MTTVPWTSKQLKQLKEYFCDAQNAEVLKNHKTRYQHIAENCLVDDQPLGKWHSKEAIKNKINDLRKKTSDDGQAIGRAMDNLEGTSNTKKKRAAAVAAENLAEELRKELGAGSEDDDTYEDSSAGKRRKSSENSSVEPPRTSVPPATRSIPPEPPSAPPIQPSSPRPPSLSFHQLRDFEKMALIFGAPIVSKNSTNTKRSYYLRRVFSSSDMPVTMEWKILHKDANNPKNILKVTLKQAAVKVKSFPADYQDTISVLLKVSPATKEQIREIPIELADDDIVVEDYFHFKQLNDYWQWEFQIAEREPAEQPLHQ